MLLESRQRSFGFCIWAEHFKTWLVWLEGETTSTTAAPLPPPVLLHKEEEYEYYKVRKSSFKLEQIMNTIDTMNDAQFVAL